MNIAHRYLEELREVFTHLSRDRSCFLTHYSTIPLLIIVFTISLSNTVITPILAITLMLALTVIIGLLEHVDINLRVLAKPIVYILALALIVTLPAIIGFVDVDVGEIPVFILRVVSATTVFVTGIQLVGWLNIILGLRILKIPGILLEHIYLTVKFIPIFIGEVLRMLIARDARTLVQGGRSSMWSLLASTVSDIIVRSTNRAWRLTLAFQARSLGNGVDRDHSSLYGGVSIYDKVLLAIAVLVVLVEVLQRV